MSELNFKVLLYCAEDFEFYDLYSIEELTFLKNNDTKHLKKWTNLLFAKILI